MSAKKIHELLMSLGITNPPAPNTMTKYIPTLKNHSKEICAMDYFVIPTLEFKMLYVLIIINHGSRQIEHFAISKNPNLEWVNQQIRNATPYGHEPKYLINDNDSVFVCEAFKTFLTNKVIKSKRNSYYSPWQNGIAERANGIIRQELPNRIIP